MKVMYHTRSGMIVYQGRRFGGIAYSVEAVHRSVQRFVGGRDYQLCLCSSVFDLPNAFLSGGDKPPGWKT